MMTGKSTESSSLDARLKFKNVQFWVSDLLKAYDENLPKKHNEWVTSIGLMGVVTDVYNPYSSMDEGELSNRPIKYDLDDGTGVIKVVHFPRARRINLPSSTLSEWQSGSSDRGFLSMLKEVKNLNQNPFSIGTCIEAKGRIQYYRGNVELLAFQVRQVSDPRLEVERTIRLCDINKKQIYPHHKL